MRLEKLLPQNIEAECGVLGSIIIDPEAVLEVSDFLLPDDFYRDAHRQIYEAVLRLLAEREPADFLTICDDLERRGTLEEVGGASYITSLINQVPTSGNVEFYGRIVERTATLRRLIHASGQIAAAAYDSGDAEAALEKAGRLIFDIADRAQHARRGAGLTHISAVLEEFRDDLVARVEQHALGKPTGVPSGFSRLDDLTGCWQRGDLITVAGRPGKGKTAVSLNMVRYAIGTGHPCAVFELEMSKLHLSRRLVSGDAPIDQLRLRTGDLIDTDTLNEWDLVLASMDRLSELPLWIDDTASITPAMIRTRLTRAVLEQGIGLAVVDYAQIMRPGIKAERRDLEIGHITREMKMLARDLNIPVILLAQLSRAADGVRPTLAMLRESGNFEQDSDVVATIWSTAEETQKMETNQPYEVSFELLKQRNGPLDSVRLRFEPRYTRFREVAREVSSASQNQNGTGRHVARSLSRPYADDAPREEEEA